MQDDTENGQRKKLSQTQKLKLGAYHKNLLQVSMKSNNGAGL